MAKSADENPPPGASMLEEESDVIDLTEEVASTARLPQAQVDELDALGLDIPAFKMPSEVEDDADDATTQRLSAEALQRANLADFRESGEPSEIEELDADELEVEDDGEPEYDRQALVKTMQMDAVDRASLEGLMAARAEESVEVLQDPRFAPEIIARPPSVLVKRWREGLPGKVVSIVGPSGPDTQETPVPEAPATMPAIPQDAQHSVEEDEIDTAVVPEEVLPDGLDDSEAILLDADDLDEADDEPAIELTEEAVVAPPVQPPEEKPSAPAKDRRPTPPPTGDDQEMRGLVQELLDEKKEARKRLRPRDIWFQEVFSEEYLRTVPTNIGELTVKDADFIESGLKLKKGSRILDLACGFGRHSLILADRGYEMVGLDLSMQLLQHALEAAQERSLSVKFIHGDMRELNFSEVFDGCFIWDTSLGYFDDRTNLRVLQGVNRALKTGGRILVDVVNRDYVVQQTPTRLWWEAADCTFLEESEFDFSTSTLHAKRSFIYHDGTPPLEQNSYVRLYNAHELRQMLHVAGFKVLEISGERHHKGYFLGATSRRVIVLAEKRAKKKPPQK